jgi:hypothetical protein
MRNMLISAVASGVALILPAFESHPWSQDRSHLLLGSLLPCRSWERARNGDGNVAGLTVLLVPHTLRSHFLSTNYLWQDRLNGEWQDIFLRRNGVISAIFTLSPASRRRAPMTMVHYLLCVQRYVVPNATRRNDPPSQCLWACGDPASYPR